MTKFDTYVWNWNDSIVNSFWNIYSIKLYNAWHSTGSMNTQIYVMLGYLYVFMSWITSTAYASEYFSHSGNYRDFNVVGIFMVGVTKRHVNRIMIRFIFGIDVNARAALQRPKESCYHIVNKPAYQFVKLFAHWNSSTRGCSTHQGLLRRNLDLKASAMAQTGATLWTHWVGTKRMVPIHEWWWWRKKLMWRRVQWYF